MAEVERFRTDSECVSKSNWFDLISLVKISTFQTIALYLKENINKHVANFHLMLTNWHNVFLFYFATDFAVSRRRQQQNWTPDRATSDLIFL